MMKSFLLPESDCPACGHSLNAASTLPDGERGPQVGDVTVCLYCATPLMFDETLHRVLLPQALLALMSDDFRREVTKSVQFAEIFMRQQRLGGKRQ